MTIDIEVLAKLARLEIPEGEMVQLEKEIPDILHFVETIQKANAPKEEKSPKHRNIMRPDENSHESSKHTKALLDAAPARVGDRIAVKQVISRKAK